MIQKIKEFKDLPFVVGKTYKTRFATGWEFTLTDIKTDRNGKQIALKGLYSNSPELGPCPINADRLVADKEFTGKEIEVCGNCGDKLYCD